MNDSILKSIGFKRIEAETYPKTYAFVKADNFDKVQVANRDSATWKKAQLIIIKEQIAETTHKDSILQIWASLNWTDQFLLIENSNHSFELYNSVGDLICKGGENSLQSFFSPRPSSPFQKIFFGTPGSGKSFRVNQIVEGAEPRTFRTTFHPDSDYASFVGCYKPTQKEATITYEFVPQTFTNAYIAAWNNPNEPHFLIIEEINRGNCAQIFGDLFQLLDRNSDGTSQYGIKADADLADYLKKHLQNSDGIANDELHLPSNLHLLATMNTSDQSLFPMDSAFKRRWAWEYVPIDYGHPVSTQFIINLSGKKYHWLNFLQKINEKIKKTTDAEDKQMGNFFINGDISEAEFKNKVMFYLWSEVCKEEYGTPRNFFRNGNDSENHEFTFNDLFTANGNELLHGFMQYVGVKEYEAFAEQIVSSTIQMEELSKAAEQEQPTLQ